MPRVSKLEKRYKNNPLKFYKQVYRVLFYFLHSLFSPVTNRIKVGIIYKNGYSVQQIWELNGTSLEFINCYQKVRQS